MQPAAQTNPVSNRSLWAGRIMSAVAVLFLLFDSVIHLMKIPPVAEAFAQLGYPLSVARGLGIIGLICLAVYVIPRTSILGAILLTGYLGGAVATQLRIGSPLFSTTLFPVYIGLLIWGGLWLRDAQLRRFTPVRSWAGRPR